MKGCINQQTIKKASKQSDFQKITKLDFSIMNLEKIQQLNLVPKLRSLILNCNKISLIENLKSVPQLRELHIESNLLRRMIGLDGCKNLAIMNLSGNKIQVKGNLIQKIQGITTLGKLEMMNLSNNKLVRMGNIDTLRQLRNIDLSHNEIEVLDFIPAFSKLQRINLSNNKIKAIMPDFFNNCSKLLQLDISHNLIRHTEFIAPLQNLQSLDLSSNQITVFQPQSIYQFLEQLDLSSNQITELPYFPNNFPDLMSLRLANNFITNQVTLLQSIAGMQSLLELDFKGNPMDSKGFEEAVSKVHSLEVVNGKVIEQAGTKYKQGIDKIIREFRQSPEIYLNDDSEDIAIKNSGFYSEELELELTGVKPNRPPSPQRKVLKSQKEFFDSCNALKEDIDRNWKRGKEIRTDCLTIWKRHGFVPNSPPPAAQNPIITAAQTFAQENLRKLEQMRVENEKKLQKWRQLKAKEKSFNIRQMSRRKKSQAENQTQQSSTNGSVQFPTIVRRTQRVDLLKTQMSAFDQKLISQAAMVRTQQKQFRQQSLRK